MIQYHVDKTPISGTVVGSPEFVFGSCRRRDIRHMDMQDISQSGHHHLLHKQVRTRHKAHQIIPYIAPYLHVEVLLCWQ